MTRRLIVIENPSTEEIKMVLEHDKRVSVVTQNNTTADTDENTKSDFDSDPDSVDPVDYDTDIHTDDIELDADGVVWDERLHASSKLKTSTGVWKKRRTVGGKDEESPLEGKIVVQPLVIPPPPPQTTIAPPPAVDRVPPINQDFTDFAQRYSASINSGEITQQQFFAVLKQFGLGSLTDLAMNLALVKDVSGALWPSTMQG